MDHFTRLLPKFPNLFDKNTSEAPEVKPEAGNTAEKPQNPKEDVPLVSSTDSHENLAFEEEEKPLEPQDISTDSTTSTMETTLESATSEGSREVKDFEENADDSGISVSHVNGSDVNPRKEVTHDDEHNEPSRDMKPVLESISALAMQLTVVSPPEIKVDKPKTLASVAKGDIAGAPPQGPRRHTEANIRTELLETGTLKPEAAMTKRRHSDFAVSAPLSINEELAMEDLKRRGSNPANKTETFRKGSIPEIVKKQRGPQWSPNMERKRQEEAKKGKKREEKRKTLAELAQEAGYKTNIEESLAIGPGALQVTKGDATKGSRESLASDPGEEHYSSIQVTGELYVSLRYEMRSNKFEVHIHSANNLASADAKKGSSDPYVKTYLLPDKRSKRKTKTKKDTLNPKFDEMLEYFIGYDELLTRTLHMSVWHKVIGRNDFLGEVHLPMNDFVEAYGNSLQQSIAKWFTLADKSDVTDGLPSIPCELVLALKYVTADKVKQKKGRNKGELHVHLLEARNLPGMDADGMSDPYCKCYLLPERKGKGKHKTPIIKRTLNPTFNHKFAYEEVSLEELKERVLEITIYDFDRASADEFLGGVRLGLGTTSFEWDDATEDECQIWQTMLSRSNVWIQVVVPLRSSMVSKKNI